VSVNTLLIGGPADGDLCAAREARDVVRVPCPVDTKHLFSEPGDVLDVAVTAENYYPETLNFFGMELQVHLHESLALGRASRTQVGNALGQHLLSDKGKAVVR
jgi:hypothetical protein